MVLSLCCRIWIRRVELCLKEEEKKWKMRNLASTVRCEKCSSGFERLVNTKYHKCDMSV